MGPRATARLVGRRAFAVDDRLTIGVIAAGTRVRYPTLRSPAPRCTLQPDLARCADRRHECPSFKATVPTEQVTGDKVA